VGGEERIGGYGIRRVEQAGEAGCGQLLRVRAGGGLVRGAGLAIVLLAVLLA
jgi:hypothetical protein